MRVQYTLEAETQAIAAASKWREQATVRGLFDLELAQAQIRMTINPRSGAVHSTVRGVVIRRILMPKSGQHLYYSVDEDAGLVVVHLVTGEPPAPPWPRRPSRFFPDARPGRP